MPKFVSTEEIEQESHTKFYLSLFQRPRIEKRVDNSPFEDNLQRAPSHLIQKRDLSHVPIGFEAMYKGPIIESRYKGPQIISQYKGSQILSQYTGAQIRSQYMGPQIISEYKGKVISMLGGVKAYEAFASHVAATSTPAVVNLAQKYDQMNQEYQREKIKAYVRNKPKLSKIFRDPWL